MWLYPVWVNPETSVSICILAHCCSCLSRHNTPATRSLPRLHSREQTHSGRLVLKACVYRYLKDHNCYVLSEVWPVWAEPLMLVWVSINLNSIFRSIQVAFSILGTCRVCKFYWWVESLWLLLHKFWSHFGISGVKYHNEKSHFQTFQHAVLACIHYREGYTK